MAYYKEIHMKRNYLVVELIVWLVLVASVFTFIMYVGSSDVSSEIMLPASILLFIISILALVIVHQAEDVNQILVILGKQQTEDNKETNSDRPT